MLQELKKNILSKPKLLCFLSVIYNLNCVFRIRIKKGNLFNNSKSFLLRSEIFIRGKNNNIESMSGSYLKNCSISIYGMNNKVMIGENCRLIDVEIHIEDNNGAIVIGKNTTIAGFTHLACIEGTRITIGEDCMFSKDITFRTGDSHSIIDEKNGLRINPSEDIIIGNHVWIGNKVIVTKGAVVGDNSIVGTGSIVTKAFDKTNIVVAGSPAKIVKEGINWLRKRI